MTRRARFGRVSSTPPQPRASVLPSVEAPATARTALAAGGLARLRVLAVAMLLLVQVGVVTVAVFDAPPATKGLAWGSLGVLLALFAYAWLRLEQPRYVDSSAARRLVVPLCLAGVAANYAFGLVSIFGGAIMLAMLLFASASSRQNARLAFWTVATSFLISALLARQGMLPYAPIMPLAVAKPWQWDASVGSVLCLYFAAYFAGRVMRREMARVVEQFERAVREASYRDALLREAQDALKHAAGFGSPGRFTDHELDGYRLGEVIGRGGMGEVYSAQRTDDGRAAALKLLRLDLLGDRQSVQRFEREAQIAASISSPHVVRVFGVSGPEAVFPYIVMERLEGNDLGSYLRERGWLPIDEVCDLVRQVAAGLEAAHERHVIHRDLKPSNVFRTLTEDGPEPVWKVLDFGVSKLNRGFDITITSHELVGTPQYMAPEQARGERDVDARADVYGLAAITYRALTGEPPFTGELPGILHQIMEQMPAAPTALADLPVDVDLVLALGLAKRREDRWPSPAAFAHALSAAARGQLEEGLRTRAKLLLEAQPFMT